MTKLVQQMQKICEAIIKAEKVHILMNIIYSK